MLTPSQTIRERELDMANKNKQSQKRKRSNNQNNSGMRLLIFITIGLIGLAALLVALNAMKANNEANNPERFTDLPTLEGQPVLGDSDAPVTVIEFGDYMCPTCMVWDETIYPELYDEYISNGDVQFAFVNVLFHGEQSQLISLASESVFAQAPEHFWDYHDALFAAQAQHGHGGEWVTVDLLLTLAEEHVPGIDIEQLEADLLNQTAMPELVTDMNLVNKYEVNRTPTIMINGIVAKNPMSYDEIKRIIDRELGAEN